MMDDRSLLKQFVEQHSDDAFGQLVKRHQDWVYSVCLRRLTDPAAAEDAVQAVFIVLAQNARPLAKADRQGTLEGWLHEAARFAAINIRRSQSRRTKHEREAATMKTETHSSPEIGLHLEQELEPALDRLSEADRRTLLLRFYRQLTHAQIAADLHLSEEAVKKRTQRALDRLRAILGKNGTPISSIALTTHLLTHAIHPIPTNLAEKLLHISTLTSANHTLAQGTLHMMKLAKLRMILLPTSIAAALIAVPFLLAQTFNSPTKAGEPTTTPSRSETASANPTSQPNLNTPLQALRLVGEAMQSLDGEKIVRFTYARNDQEKTVAGYFINAAQSYKSLKNAIIAKFGAAALADAGPSSVLKNPDPFTDDLLHTAKVDFQKEKAIIHLQTKQQPSDILAVKDQGMWKISLASLEGLDQMPPDSLPQFFVNAKLVMDSKMECVNSVHRDMDAGKFHTLGEVLNALEERMKQPIRTTPSETRP